MYLSMSIDLPSQNPSKLIPTVQMRGADHVRDREPARVHAPGTGEDRHDRAHERDEAGEHDRSRPAPVEEVLTLLEVLGLEQPGVGLEQAGAVVPADRVADLRAEHRGHERADHHRREVEVRVLGVRAGRAEGAGEHQDRVAGQRDRQQPRLHEHHQDEADRPEGLDEVAGAEPVDCEHGGAR